MIINLQKVQEWHDTRDIKAFQREMSESDFNEFVLQHLTKGSRGPSKKPFFYRIFHYILKLLHTGCKWEELPIEKDERRFPEIHYSNIFQIFQRLVSDGCFETIFFESIGRLFENKVLGKKLIISLEENTTKSEVSHS